jgi:putative transposase
MLFENDNIYHVFNQGNNRQPIFYSRENYLFFLKKIKSHVLPFADLLAWCLMPNHFHLMIYVNSVEIKKSHIGFEDQHLQRSISLNESIGTMLRSYTRAINRQQDSSGSLFRKETKAICVNCNYNIALSWFLSQGITQINNHIPEKEYPNVCYNYILFNPLKDGLVGNNSDWEFSSYPDVSGQRNGMLINRERIEQVGLNVFEPGYENW